MGRLTMAIEYVEAVENHGDDGLLHQSSAGVQLGGRKVVRLRRGRETELLSTLPSVSVTTYRDGQ
jgi:hypothetical protein